MGAGRFPTGTPSIPDLSRTYIAMEKCMAFLAKDGPALPESRHTNRRRRSADDPPTRIDSPPHVMDPQFQSEPGGADATARASTFPSRLPAGGLVAGLLTLLLGTAGCEEKKAAAPPPPPPVLVQTLTPTNVILSTEFIGQLDSPQNVEVRARVEAFVDAIPFIEGTEVKEGDLLFKLDPKPFQQRLDAALGALAEARAALNKYEKDVARLQPLAEKRAIPQQDLDNAVASVEVGKANVLSAEARVESARIDLGYCEVHAPVSGLIGAKQVTVGSLVGKGQPTLMATISTLDPIWFYCGVSEVDYLRAERAVQETGHRVGDLPVRLILADGTELAEPGKWVFIDRAVDVATGTIRLRAEFPNARKVLRPGMFARARIGVQSNKSSLLVPQRAVVELQGKLFLWVVGEDKTATQRSIVARQRLGPDWIVEDGVKAGDRIVVEGLQKVHEGAPVMPLTAAEMAAMKAKAEAAAEAAPAKAKAKE